uniref:Uncharacterized protein n=1 Tax=Octopus bimaculoides TaxID=37653 RepID=A0A0L8HA48_OCTBM
MTEKICYNFFYSLMNITLIVGAGNMNITIIVKSRILTERYKDISKIFEIVTY